MTKTEEALEVLIRAREQLVKEIATCGQAGGVGRAQNYAPVLVNVANALAVVQALHADEQQVVDKMAAMRAAKASKQAQAA